MHHSRAVHDTVVAAIVDAGMSAPEAVEAAGRGELGTIGKVQVPVSTARDWAGAARRDRPAGEPKPEADSLVVVDAAEVVLRGLVAGETERLRWEPDVQAGTRLARLAQELEAMAKKRERRLAGAQPETPRPARRRNPWERVTVSPDDEDAVRALVAEERQRVANGRA
jgi:hypothetical protein